MGGMDSRPGSRVVPGDAEGFESLAPALGVRVRRALVAAYGVEVGSEAAADSMVYAWEHWEKVQTMDNPAGHLYRVGQSAARKYRPRRPIALPAGARVGLTVPTAPALGAASELLALPF
jgi:hypothetical protein